MTVGEVEAAAAQFHFVGGFSMWKPAIRVRRDTGVPVLWLQIEIPDSEDLACRRLQDLNTGVALDALAGEKRTPEQFVMDAIVRFFLHELYESILVRGARLFDPHDAHAYHPGAL